MGDRSLVGRTGRITSGGAILGGGQLGEVMVDGEAYYALASDPDVPIPPQTQVLVVELHPPRTLVVTPI
jgi:hypothetical protein